MYAVLPNLEAKQNFLNLKRSSYPGRWFILGVDETGKNLIQVYAIMGRSPNSRNRVFDFEGGRLFTKAFDATKMSADDAKLIIYNAMEENGDFFVVSNGVQTNDALSALSGGYELARGLEAHEFEDDAPNHTPRITGVLRRGLFPQAEISIIKKPRWGGAFVKECDRMTYRYDRIANGFGFFISTYAGDGSPLPSFQGEPLLMPLTGDIDDIAKCYWSALGEHRVSLAVKSIPVESGAASVIKIINQNSKA